jgi:small subunit ribosomal protein S18
MMEDSNNYHSSLIPNSVLFNRKNTTRRGSRCPLSGKDAPVIDYKNIALLSQYVSEKGRILPSRITNVCAKKQRAIKRAINIARTLALLPFAAK